jgi:hypothetical protein
MTNVYVTSDDRCHITSQLLGVYHNLDDDVIVPLLNRIFHKMISGQHVSARDFGRSLHLDVHSSTFSLKQSAIIWGEEN